MIDIDEYIEMWDDHLLGSQGCADLTNALIAEVKRLREGIKEQVRMLIEGCCCEIKTECTEKLGEMIE